jgi:hypothetical protein
MRHTILLTLGLLGILCGESTAASPALSVIQPRGGQRGTEVVATFSGARLGDAQEVLVYYPGVSVKKLEPVNETTLKVTFAIGPDCRLGEHAFRVRTAGGVSDLRTFWVGALPVVEEVEPNSEFDKPQPIPLNCTVHGIVQSEDVDHFVVECKKGQRLSVEIEGMRLGNALFDPYVAIMDARRFELATSDDSPLTGQDGGCSIVVPADGKYIIQVRESAYGGNGACQYRLHVGHFPRPTAVVPAGGKPGEELEVTFVGDPTGQIKQRVKVPAAGDLMWRLHCETKDGVSPTGFKFRVGDLPNVIESGANNAPTGATPGVAPGALNGVIAKPGETDFFKFPAKKGQVFDVRVYARQLGSPLDSVLTVGVLGGNQIAANDDSGGPDSYVRFTTPDDKEIVLSIRDHLNKGGPDYFYRIEVTPVRPAITTTVQRADPNNPSNQDRQALIVPQGNRVATLVTVGRTDFGGPVAVGFGQLPPGVTLSADTLDAGQGVLPVVLEAKPDAKGVVLTAITATPADPKAPVGVASRTVFDTAFALGPGQTVFSRHVTEKTAVAVAEPAPFTLEVAEPKVPVVQNGSYTLRIVAKRAEGFKGPITVMPVWAPPGLGIVSAATIAPDSNETTLAMNAAPNAAPKKWKTAVHAFTDTPKGRVWTSSQLFGIEVAPPAVVMTMERPAVEQGQQTQLFCKVTVNAPFDGKAKVKLVGLPAKVTTAELELAADEKELAFPITADKASAAGKHGGIFCQVLIEKNGERITQNAGGTELRIDVPIAPKTGAATPAKPNTPHPAATPGQPAKRLTRLEQLRLEQEEREKAEKAGKKEEKK